MSSSSNSFLRGQRKSDLLELAETVGLEKYVRRLFLLKLSRPLEDFFATRGLASPPAHRFVAGPAVGAVASRHLARLRCASTPMRVGAICAAPRCTTIR